LRCAIHLTHTTKLEGDGAIPNDDDDDDVDGDNDDDDDNNDVDGDDVDDDGDDKDDGDDDYLNKNKGFQSVKKTAFYMSYATHRPSQYKISKKENLEM
jgi:hypothetical protein